MAFEYFKYDTGYTNTLVARSNTSFAPLVPPYKQIYYNILIPETQPLYLYRESGGTIIINSTTVVDEYLKATEAPPTSDGNVTYGEFSGTTTALQANKLDISGGTMQGKIFFSIPSTDTNFGSIGKNNTYAGLDIRGLAGLSLNTPYLAVPQWSGHSGAQLTVGTNGLITLTTAPTGSSTWTTTGGTNAIVANVPEDLGIVVTPTQNVVAGTITWSIDFTNNGNQSATVTLQAVVNSVVYPDKQTYTVGKSQTSKLSGTSPISTTIASGSTLDIRIASNYNGTVNKSSLTISKSGNVNVVWGNISGSIANQTDLQAALNLKLNKSIYQTYTGTTAPATYASKSFVSNYTGVTAPNTYLSKSTFATYTGTTVPNTYYNKTQINSYTGATLTNINSRLLTSTFNTWSGTTLPANYYNKTQINAYSASTLTNINSRLLTSTFNTWSGTTLPNTYLKKTTFATYTGTTAPNQFASKANAITGATNLGTATPIYTSVSGNKIQLKSLSGGSGISISNTANAITICSTITQFNWSGSTANGVGTYVSATCVKSNPNMTFNGSSLSVTGNILASTYVCSPIITGSTRICSPIICGTSCVTSPITCGTTKVQSPILTGSTCVISPIILGSTSVCSPTVCSSTCLCSTGTATFTGAVVDSSSLSVSGATKLSAVKACQVVFGNNTTCQLTGSTGMLYNPTTCTLCANYLQLTGAGAYYYAERLTTLTNGTTTCAKYLGLTGTSMVAGCYALDFTGTFGTSGSNGETLIKFTCNNGIIGGKETYFRMSIAVAEQTASTSRNITLAAGTNCFDIWFRACAQTACADYGMIRVRRLC